MKNSTTVSSQCVSVKQFIGSERKREKERERERERKEREGKKE